MDHHPLSDSIVGRLDAGENLSLQEMAGFVDSIMQGQCSEDQVVRMLEALRRKGETVEEIAGAARAMRQHMTPIRTLRRGVVDTCGTGGDASGTFNISTAAALVAAAAGIPVAKHGNRGITSRSGSADVLGELGVNIHATVSQVERCLDDLGICFCFAQELHPAMKYVAAARRRVGSPTIFNLLGPLCNPASASHQLLGVGKPHLRTKLAESLALLGTRHAIVVSGDDGLDEVTLGGATRVSEVSPEGFREHEWRPADFGISPADRQTLQVDGPPASARLIREILKGAPGPPRDIVVMNAAAAIWTASSDESLEACTRRAIRAIDDGAARELLARLVELSNSPSQLPVGMVR